MAERRITGKHVLIGFVTAFSVIIGVNLVLAYAAVSTFPGLEVKNSYVASQEFNDRKAAQEGLGWTVVADHAGGLLVLHITDEAGNPVEVAKLEATVGRATHVQDDQTPDFQYDGQAYVAPVALGNGNWNIRMKAWDRDGTLFQQRVVLHKE
ncbi:nitrogen fixation protein FixH [Roseovarius sp. MBR-51]